MEERSILILLVVAVLVFIYLCNRTNAVENFQARSPNRGVHRSVQRPVERVVDRPIDRHIDTVTNVVYPYELPVEYPYDVPVEYPTTCGLYASCTAHIDDPLYSCSQCVFDQGGDESCAADLCL